MDQDSLPSQDDAAPRPDEETNRRAQPVDTEQPPRLPFPVVGVGASAGGIEAFGELLDAMQPDSGMAFVFILHLPADAESHLAGILARRTAMPVRQVEDGMPVEPDHVYVIRPGHVTTIRDGRLRLGPELGGPRAANRPVDDLFRSLAEEQRERAICVVLSGLGSNGTAGAQAVKAVGGLCIAQDPDTAQYPSMPRHLVEAGYADHILRPAEIPDVLLAYAASSYASGGREQAAGPVLDREGHHLREILAVLRTRTRQDFSGYKKATLLRRVQRRMGLARLGSMAEYARLLRQTPSEVTSLSDDLLIHVTGFFRDPEAWDALRSRVIAPLVAGRDPGGSVRAWVSACSSGEEAYSLAMLLVEEAERAGKPLDVKVFATDLADRTLAHARAGVYPGGIESEINPARLERFFARESEMYRVRADLRDRVVFAPQNILQDPPFSRLDIATCRNLLIYLEPDVQRRVLHLLHFGLREGGALFLGSSEAVGGADGLFEAVDRKARIFRRVGPTRHGAIDFPLPHPLGAAEGRPLGVATGALPARPTRADGPPTSLGELTRQALLESHTPPAVTVDRDGHVVYFHGDAAPYLRMSGEPTRELLLMAREGIRGTVRAALHRAAAEGARATEPGGWIDREPGRRARVAITASPVPDPAGGDRPPPYFVVSFEERGEVPAPGSAPPDAPDGWESEVRRLRGELQGTIEELQTSNEELKASNEEVTSVNEELQSTNEELETSKEEMQSLNEELTTVNAQLRAKMEEHQAASSDLASLLASTDIAVLFLDTDLRIRRFTPAVRDLIDLIPGDVGRPIAALAHNFDDPDLDADCRSVLDRLIPAEREVAGVDGRYYQRRATPYRTTDNRIDGIVLTFVDMTPRRRADQVVRASEERQAYLLRLSDLLRPLDDPAKIRAAAARFLGEHLGVNRAVYAEVAGEDWSVAEAYVRGVEPPQDRHPTEPFGRWIIDSLRAGQMLVIRDVGTDPRFEPSQREAHEAIQIVAAAAVPLVKGDELVAILVAQVAAPRDWTEHELGLIEETAERTWAAVERARAEASLRVSEEKYRSLFNSMDEAYAVVEMIRDEATGRWADFLFLEVNPAFVEHTGMAYPVGRTATQLIGEPNPRWAETYGRAAETGEPLRLEVAEPILDRTFDLNIFRLGGPGSRRVAVLFTNITDRRRREQNLAFLADIAHDFAGLWGGDQIMRAVGEKLARFMNIQRCHFALIDETADECRFLDRWDGPGLPPLPPVIRLSEVASEALLDPLRRRATASSNAVEYGPGMRDAHAKVGTGAYITVPFQQRGDWKYVFSVNAIEYRRWRDDEIELVEEIANRLFPRLERARAEAAFREGEERLRLAVAIAGLGTWDWDVRTGRVVWNAEHFAMQGYTPGEVAPSYEAWRARVHPDDRPAAEAALNAAHDARAPFAHDFRALHPDGSVRWLSARGIFFYDEAGAAIRMIGVMRDVTDQRQAEDALRRSEERLRLALSAARTGTWAWDVAADMHTRDANLNALLGLGPVESVRPFAEFLGHVHPDDRDFVRTAFDQTARHGRPLGIEFRVVRPDGEVAWLRDQGDVFDAGGQARLAGACVEVTDLKEAEAALRRANDELEGRVAERTADLERAMDSLAAEMGRRRELAQRLGTAQEDERRRVSRDLHDTIGQLMVGLSLAFKAVEMSGDLPASAAAKLADAQRVADALGREVHGLAIRLRPTSLDDLGLVPALEHLVAEWSERAGTQANFMTADLGTGRLSPEIETVIYRVVQEALTNVAKHARASATSVVLSRSDGHVMAVIEDDGVGFVPGSVPAGRLGLVGMEERISLVGGTLEVESAPGSGTTLLARIPISRRSEGGDHGT
ncbi:chemotaxis protein CheB [Tundrisphaera sp. TA3]|uniref:chemotaxis protein CheB n=1 Tax=Tundrisphaera sp. TA3 TaxID=3435775 RepID=UPI003EB7DB00